MVKCVEEQEFDKNQAEKLKEYQQERKENKKAPKFKEQVYKINPYADRFYIPEDMKYTADIKFEKKGNSWAGAIIFSLIMVVVFVAILVALPHIFELLNDLAGSIDTTPDNII